MKIYRPRWWHELALDDLWQDALLFGILLVALTLGAVLSRGCGGLTAESHPEGTRRRAEPDQVLPAPPAVSPVEPDEELPAPARERSLMPRGKEYLR